MKAQMIGNGVSTVLQRGLELYTVASFGFLARLVCELYTTTVFVFYTEISRTYLHTSSTAKPTKLVPQKTDTRVLSS